MNSGPGVADARRGRPRSLEADHAIAQAALDLLREEGYASVTMAGVAERAGVSTATLYRRWASKEALVVGALATMARAKPAVDTGSLTGDLTAILTGMATGLSGDGGRILSGLVGETVRNPHLARALRDELLGSWLAGLRALLERAVERGEIPPLADPALAVSLVLGPFHHRLLVTGEPITPATARALVPMLVRAFGAGAARG